MSFTLINSLKTILISFPLKLLLKLSGLLFTILGDKVSFSPPVIKPLLAQLVKSKRVASKKEVFRNFVIVIKNGGTK